MPSITIQVTVSAENVQAVVDTYKEITGEKPTDKWVREFLIADADNLYGDIDGVFTDDLYDVISESLDEDDEVLD